MPSLGLPQPVILLPHRFFREFGITEIIATNAEVLRVNIRVR